MADTSITITKVDHWHEGKRQYFIGTMAVGAAALTYPAGGIPVDFRAAGFRGTQKPFFVIVDGIAGFLITYDRTAGKIRVFQDSTPAAAAPLSELATDSAIPAALSGDTIRFLAIGVISG